jgi:hypothetical protein
MALSSSNISPTCRANEADVRSALQTRPGLARPPAPTAGAFFFREFVASADSFLLPQLRRRSAIHPQQPHNLTSLEARVPIGTIGVRDPYSRARFIPFKHGACRPVR